MPLTAAYAPAPFASRVVTAVLTRSSLVGGPAEALARRGPGAVLPLHPGRVDPQSLQPVVIAFLVVEHVHNEVHEVEEDPPRPGFALDPGRLRSLPSQSLHHLFGDGLDLA